VLGTLVVVALALITISFREDSNGPLHDVQGAVAGALQPLEIAVERVARPFRDAYGWTKDLFNARSENEKLREENTRLKQEVIQNESALQQNVILRGLLDYQDAPTFPKDFHGVATQVIAQPSGAFEKEIVVAAGSDDGVVVGSPVVTAAGLVGTVTSLNEGAARVRLIVDQASAVSAVDLRTQADGIVEPQPGGSLMLDRVGKDEVVHVGDEVVTSGSRAGQLASLYPRNIPIGRVTFVGKLSSDLYQQVLIRSDVDFTGLDSVFVLVSTKPSPELP
jgi:rod shape-determining protein MreC